MSTNRPVAAPAPQQYYQPYQPPFQPYAVPVPVQVVHQPAQQVPQFRGLSLATTPPQQTQLAHNQRPAYQPPTQQYGYGWIQDPMYYSLTSAPPPVRPQMGGETFLNRVAKNAGLAMLESLFGQCLLAVRQMVLPPVPKVVEAQVQPSNETTQQ